MGVDGEGEDEHASIEPDQALRVSLDGGSNGIEGDLQMKEGRTETAQHEAGV
jgi:hypothetical protein